MSNYHDHSKNINELAKQIPNEEIAEEIADILSVLSDPTRLRILWLLCHTTECVTDIGIAIGMSAPAVSHHLKLLKSHKIITSKKDGKEMLYTISDNKHAQLIHSMIDEMLNIKKED